MKNWMVTLKSVCDACIGVPNTYKKLGKLNVLVTCSVCGGSKCVEKKITISSFASILNAVQDGYNSLQLTNMIDAIKDGY